MIHRCIVVLLGSSISLNAWGASSVLVWPIFQTISASDKGSELWLENRGATAVNLQLRIFGWDQKESKDLYADQNDVVSSPPFANVQPGQRQLIRLMRVSPVASGQEKSYRIVIDEIPAAQPTKQTDKSSAEYAHALCTAFVYLRARRATVEAGKQRRTNTNRAKLVA